MSIKTLARTWDVFGKRDPDWAALTDRRLSLERAAGPQTLRWPGAVAPWSVPPE